MRPFKTSLVGLGIAATGALFAIALGDHTTGVLADLADLAVVTVLADMLISVLGSVANFRRLAKKVTPECPADSR